MTQVSRFDTSKESPRHHRSLYRLARQEVPDLQLALVGSMAWARSRGFGYLAQIRSALGGREARARVHEPDRRREHRGQRLPGAVEGGDPEVAARYGLVVAGAVEGDAGRRGARRTRSACRWPTAWAVSWSTASRSARARWCWLIQDKQNTRGLGASGRERVRRHFLTPRMLLDELSLMRRLASGATTGRASSWPLHRDPVSGIDRRGRRRDRHAGRQAHAELLSARRIPARPSGALPSATSAA